MVIHLDELLFNEENSISKKNFSKPYNGISKLFQPTQVGTVALQHSHGTTRNTQPNTDRSRGRALCRTCEHSWHVDH